MSRWVAWSSVPAAQAGSGPWLVYALVDPTDDCVRYIGVTSTELEQRVAGHITKPTNQSMRTWLRELKSAGLRPTIRLLIAVTDQWEMAERGWIAWFRARGDLLNVDPGGVCRDKNGKPIASKMRPERAWGDEPRRRKRRKVKEKTGPIDPWAKVRGTAAAKAAEVSAKQMKTRGQ